MNLWDAPRILHSPSFPRERESGVVATVEMLTPGLRGGDDVVRRLAKLSLPLFALPVLTLLSPPLPAQPAATTPASPEGSASTGKGLHDKDCVACHARKFDGDAAKIYTRPDHKVTSRAQLKAQIAYCNTELGAGYFPEEEEHLAAYLNLQYYRFKP